MESSQALINAQIQFLDTALCLVHIPLESYSIYIQHILRLLLLVFEEDKKELSHNNVESNHSSPKSRARHTFVNIAVTSTECSVFCPRSEAEKLFREAPASTSLEPGKAAALSKDDYFVIQVEGQDLNAGQRVLELSGPLALAGISIFFITTYTTDYILVPQRSRSVVEQALSDRGFAFEPNTAAFTHTSTLENNHARNLSNTSSNDSKGRATPPPTDIDELQLRTFATLKHHGILPTVDESIRLVSCAARDLPPQGTSHEDQSRPPTASEMEVSLGLVKCLLTQPRFLSITLTEFEAISLLIERRLLNYFPNAPEVLNGTESDVLIPITLDLHQLPLESTGIVCGVAGRLTGSTTRNSDTAGTVEMSYLSMSRTGNVIVYEDELENAIDALRGAQGTDVG